MPSARAKVKGRKGKLGKNKHRIVAYYGSGRNLWNKARGIAHHVRRYGKGDASANTAMKLLLAGMSLRMQRDFERAYEQIDTTRQGA